MSHGSVQECAVTGAPHHERGEIVKAFVILKDNAVPCDALIVELQEHVKRITAPYKYPRAIEFVETLPKTATGKTQRSALKALEKQRFIVEK